MASTVELPRELHDHWVQFYETEAFLTEKVTAFLLDGLRGGEAAIIIATESHRAAFLEALGRSGVDAEAALAREDLMILDAVATLDTFMVGGTPDPIRFEQNVGRKLDVLSRSGTRKVRAYGEMVDALWRTGQRDAAILLEELWNDLRRRRQFTLLCAYVIDSFHKHDGIHSICSTHSHVLLPESHGGTDPASLSSANLHSLISEIARRTEVEAALRGSVSELRRSEQNANRAKEDLEDFVNNAAVAIHRVDGDGIIRYVNRAETELLGYSAEEMVGHHISEFHVDHDTLGDILACLKRGETIRDRDACLRAKDGALRYVQITSNSQLREGEFVSTRCFTRDVTASRQTVVLHEITAALSRALTAEEVARAVIHESRKLIGAPAGSVILLDDAGAAIERVIVDGDARKETAAGLEAMPLSAGLPVCEAARTNKLVWVVGAKALASYPDLNAIRMAENVQTWGAVPIVFEGRTLGAIDFRCSYERPLLPDEESMLVAVGRQCGLAVERARLHDAAEVAREQAESASRAKDEFLAMLGHELRNPLSPILTAVQLMRLRGDDATTREQNIIERHVNHLIHIVDDLLDISRITQGKVEVDKRPVRLAHVITKAVEIVAPQCEERRHELSVDVASESIWVEADETRLCQVITNLLTNAVKYTNPGGHLQLRVAHDDEQVRISVKDDGNGIAPELLPRVFDLFVQGKRTSERSHGGLGIGLSLVRNLVAMHGGSVSASSAGAGRGSEFVVQLPIIDLRRALAQVDGERNIRQRVEVTARKIMVVDDNQDAAELLGEMLRSVGHDVLVANDGHHALDLIKHFRPEVAILDIGLPDMDGYELAGSLRSHLGQGVRLMAVTGYGQRNDLVRAQVAGFDHHFTKPVGLSKILAAIEVDG
jgi:PAS domain S-box-containing protein